MARQVMAAILLVAAIAKGLSFAEGSGARAANVVITLLELGGAVALFQPGTSALATPIVVAGFAGASLTNLAHLVLGSGVWHESCGCFGTVAELSRGQSLVIQGVVISLGAVALSAPRAPPVP